MTRPGRRLASSARFSDADRYCRGNVRSTLTTSSASVRETSTTLPLDMRQAATKTGRQTATVEPPPRPFATSC